MTYVFYGFDLRFPNKKKESFVNASSLSEAKVIMQARNPLFIATCIYPEIK